MEQITLKKIGVVFKPPSIVLLYKDKLDYKKRTMPLRDLKVDSDCQQLASRLKTRHKHQLGDLNAVRIEKLIRLVQENLKGTDKAEALEIIRKEYELDPCEDLNKLTDKELKRRKEIMDLSFEKNCVGKGHPDFVYDREVGFDGVKAKTDWDSGSEISEGSKDSPGLNKSPAPKKFQGGPEKSPEVLEKTPSLEKSPGVLEKSLGSDKSESDNSTPVNSPSRKLETLVSARHDLFGLDSSSSEEELLPQPKVKLADRLPQPAIGTTDPPSLSAGEEQVEEDDFW